jgi:hypothetical protein
MRREKGPRMNTDKPVSESERREAEDRSASAVAPARPAPPPSQPRYTFAFDRWLPTAAMNEFVWA